MQKKQLLKVESGGGAGVGGCEHVVWIDRSDLRFITDIWLDTLNRQWDIRVCISREMILAILHK